MLRICYVFIFLIGFAFGQCPAINLEGHATLNIGATNINGYCGLNQVKISTTGTAPNTGNSTLTLTASYVTTGALPIPITANANNNAWVTSGAKSVLTFALPATTEGVYSVSVDLGCGATNLGNVVLEYDRKTAGTFSSTGIGGAEDPFIVVSNQTNYLLNTNLIFNYTLAGNTYDKTMPPSFSYQVNYGNGGSVDFDKIENNWGAISKPNPNPPPPTPSITTFSIPLTTNYTTASPPQRYNITGRLRSVCNTTGENLFLTTQPYVFIIGSIPPIAIEAYHGYNTTNTMPVLNPVICGSSVPRRTLRLKMSNVNRNYLGALTSLPDAFLNETETWEVFNVTTGVALSLFTSSAPTTINEVQFNGIASTVVINGTVQFKDVANLAKPRSLTFFNPTAGSQKYRIRVTYVLGLLGTSSSNEIDVLVVDRTSPDKVDFTLAETLTPRPSANGLGYQGDISLVGNINGVLTTPYTWTSDATKTYPLTHHWKLEATAGIGALPTFTRKDLNLTNSGAGTIASLFGNLSQGFSYKIQHIVSLNNNITDAGCFKESSWTPFILPKIESELEFGCIYDATTGRELEKANIKTGSQYPTTGSPSITNTLWAGTITSPAGQNFLPGSHDFSLSIETQTTAPTGATITTSFIDKKTLTVNADPTIEFVDSLILCEGTDTPIAVTNPNASTTEPIKDYTWNIVGTNYYNQGSSFTVPGSAIPSAGENVQVSVTGNFFGAKCQTTTITQTIASLAIPQVDFTFNSDCLYPGNGIALTASESTSADITDYSWHFNNGTAQSAGTNAQYNLIIPQPLAAQTYPLKLIATANNGCKNEKTKTVLVQERLNPVFRPDILAGFFCSGSDVPIFIDGIANPALIASSHIIVRNITTSTEYQIDNTTTTPLNSSYRAENTTNQYLAPFTVKGHIVNTQNCLFDIDSPNPTGGDLNFFVYRKPELVLNDQSGCTGTIADYTYPGASFVTGVTGTTTWSYTPTGGTSTGFTPATHNFVAGQYDIQAISTLNNTSCTNTQIAQLTVNPKPTASFTINPTPSPADASNAICPTCPIIYVGIPWTANGTTSIAGVGATIASYNWSVGGTNASITNPITYYTFNSAGASGMKVEPIKLEITNNFGCSHDFTENILVLENLVTANFIANITATNNTNTQVLSGCHDNTPSVNGFVVQFTDNSSNATQYSWDFGDGSSSTLQAPQHVFTNNTTTDKNYTVKLTARNGLDSKDRTMTITVFAQPVTGFTVTNTVLRLTDGNPSASMVILQNTASTEPNVNWNFGDGNTSTSNASRITHPYTVRSFDASLPRYRYTITQTVTSVNNCVASFSNNNIWVKDYEPTADFKILVNSIEKTEVCNGGEVEFTNDLFKHTERYAWDFGRPGEAEASYQYNPTTNIRTTYSFASLAADRTINIKATAIRLNADETPAERTSEITKTLVVSPQPVTFFSLDYRTVYLANNPAQSEKAKITLANVGGVNTLEINWGDGNTDSYNSPTLLKYEHVYAPIAAPLGGHETEHLYNIEVKMISTKGCTDSFTQEVTVINPSNFPIAKIRYPSNFETCAPSTLVFNNDSEFYSRSFWELTLLENLDGSPITKPVRLTSDEKDFITALQVGGKYRIKLTAYNRVNEEHSVSDDLEIYPNTVASFILRDTNPKVAMPTEFINLSRNATEELGGEFEWDFGDGKTAKTDAKNRNAFHRYAKPGIYTVRLIAKNKYNCIYAMEDEIRVGVASASVDKVFAYPNVFRPTQPEGTISIGEGQSKENTIFLPINTLIPDEIRSYKMSIYDKKGELIFVSNNVDEGWDGTYRGKLLSQDVYIWQVEAVLVNNAKINQAGDVLLLR